MRSILDRAKNTFAHADLAVTACLQVRPSLLVTEDMTDHISKYVTSDTGDSDIDDLLNRQDVRGNSVLFDK